MEMKQKAKFDIGNLLPIGITILVLGIALAYGLQIMGDLKSDMTINSLEANATANAMEGIAKIPEKLQLIVTVILAAVIIGIIVKYLWMRNA
jgi:Na+-transporting methylmalonyl-CoA/oxaloacetate decarboxylase gamma subunit